MECAFPVGSLQERAVTIDRSWWSWTGAHGGHLASLGLAAMRARLAEDLEDH
jgi:hypothetical protein